MHPQLVAICGAVDRRVIPLVNPEISFGRHPSNTVVLDDGSVSRYHCCIKQLAAAFHIFDLQSLNGTFINDVAAPERTLKHGDRIRIGRSEFLFLIEAGDVNFEPKPDAHGPIAKPSRPSGWTGTTAEMSSTDFLDLT